VFIQPRQTFKWCLDILRRDITDLLGLEDANKPPVAVTIVHEEQTIALHYIGLAIDGCCEAVEGIDEIKVYGLVGHRQRRGIVVVVEVFLMVFPIRIVFEYRVLFVVGSIVVRGVRVRMDL
jgi:hypothetical protein